METTRRWPLLPRVESLLSVYLCAPRGRGRGCAFLVFETQAEHITTRGAKDRAASLEEKPFSMRMLISVGYAATVHAYAVMARVKRKNVFFLSLSLSPSPPARFRSVPFTETARGGVAFLLAAISQKIGCRLVSHRERSMSSRCARYRCGIGASKLGNLFIGYCVSK